MKSKRDRSRDYAFQKEYRELAQDKSERVAMGEVSFSRALASIPCGARLHLKRAVQRKFREVA